MNEGIIHRPEQVRGLSIEDYHASPYISASKISDFARRGPRYYAMRHVKRQTLPPPPSTAQAFGQAFEDLICEPAERWSEAYAVKPADMTFTTKEGKAWRAAQQIAGKTIITQDERDDLFQMREAMWENETACALIRGTAQQVSFRAPYAGTPGVQARPDFVGKGNAWSAFRPFIVDLKTTIKFSRLQSGRAVIDYGYHVQAALALYAYSEWEQAGEWAKGHRPDIGSHLLVVEKCAPYRCQVLTFTAAWIDAGWAWASAQLDALARHYATDTWPRVAKEAADLPPPPKWIDRGSDNDDETEEEAAA